MGLRKGFLAAGPYGGSRLDSIARMGNRNVIVSPKGSPGRATSAEPSEPKLGSYEGQARKANLDTKASKTSTGTMTKESIGDGESFAQSLG